MSASATAHLFMLLYSLTLVHRPKDVLLVTTGLWHSHNFVAIFRC